MVYSLKIKFIVFIILISITLLGVLYLVFNNVIFADESKISGSPDISVNLKTDIDQDGSDELISLLTYRLKDGENLFYLEIKKNFFRIKKIELEEFETDLSFCDQSIIDGKNKYVCITGYVGVHSQRTEVIGYKDGNFSKSIFVDSEGNEGDNLIADVPNITVLDNKPGNVRICADNRNYELDPMVDFFRTCYILNDKNKFVFEYSETGNKELQINSEGKVQ